MSATVHRPVSALDRVSDVLARDERLVEVFARQSPHFAKLRNPMMRRVMARLVTVEQAARICDAPVDTLLQALNQALGIDVGAARTDDRAGDARAAAGASDTSDTRHAGGSPAAPQAQPMAPVPFALPTGAHVVELDVREDLRLGHEPFSRIMASVAALHEDDVLHLRATFEPVPLFAVLAKRGFDHHAEQAGDDDWSVWFYRQRGDVAAAPAGTPGSAPTEDAPDTEASTPAGDAPGAPGTPDLTPAEGEIVLDVRGLEPPEPMQRTLEAVEQLPEGATLVHVNVRVPHFLLPILRERGFDYAVYQANPERVVVHIWRASPAAPARDVPGA